MPATCDKQWSLADIANMSRKTTVPPNMADLILHVVRQQQLHACHAKMDSVTLLACLTLPVKYLVGLQPARCRTCETSNIIQWSCKSRCTHWTHWKSKGHEELHGFTVLGCPKGYLTTPKHCSYMESTSGKVSVMSGTAPSMREKTRLSNLATASQKYI